MKILNSKKTTFLLLLFFVGTAVIAQDNKLLQAGLIAQQLKKSPMLF
jgi:hypothetical protein